MNKNLMNGQSAKAASAQMIEEITNEISNAIDQAIRSERKINILGGKFYVSWFESMDYYTFLVEDNSNNWSDEITIDVDKWNEMAEEAQEDIANDLAISVFMRMNYFNNNY